MNERLEEYCLSLDKDYNLFLQNKHLIRTNDLEKDINLLKKNQDILLDYANNWINCRIIRVNKYKIKLFITAENDRYKMEEREIEKEYIRGFIILNKD